MAEMPNQDMLKTIQYLQEVETLGQEILIDKNSKLELANAQNKFREALRALENTSDKKSWLQVGSIYLYMSTKACKIILQEDLAIVTEELNEKHDQIRKKVAQLRDLEHLPNIKGFGLTPLSAAETKVLYRGFGIE